MARYVEWSRPFTPSNAKPAVLAFNGDVYDGLDARSLSEAQLDYAQAHLRILSGLYGLLKPLDLMQPYRLEMGTRFKNGRGKDLYAFWGMTQTEALNRLLARDEEAGRAPVLVNLASEEYFKSVKPAQLKGRLLNIGFEDWKGGRYKIISFYAKRARGLMARYAITHQVERVDQLQGFNVDGYAFAAEASEYGPLGFPAAPGLREYWVANPQKVAQLARMKGLASGALVLVVVLFLFARQQGWPWVAAFAEAAMIGALADWFAVVALFSAPAGFADSAYCDPAAQQGALGR